MPTAKQLEKQGSVKYETKRKMYELLRSSLTNERSSFLSHWKDLNDYILPRRGRFQVTDVNRGDRRNLKIIDSTATMAHRTLRSGMMAGITSPAREWKKLTTPDPDLAEFGSVREWLDIVNKRMSSMFLRSNLYNSLPIIYGDMGTFGTSALLIEEDFGNVIRTYPFPIGSYMISNNANLQVDTFMREFRMTVRQLVEKFGTYNTKSGSPNWDVFSPQVKAAYDESNYEVWIDVVQAITPNREWNPKMTHSKHKRYSSCYYEKGAMGTASSYLDGEYDRYLRESGYDYFPVLCPRWEVTGEDAYATDCPGMTALGDTKALQTMHKRKAQAIETHVRPPMTGPSSLKNSKSSILPGDLTLVDESRTNQGFKPAFQIDPRIQELLLDIESHQKRIQRAYYEDLFLMLAQSDRREITATEIEVRQEEKLLALGPVLEQTNQDLLDPLISIAFQMMVRQNMIPEAPEELQGMDLKVDYISVMHQAQKLVGIGNLERTTNYVGSLAQIFPEVKHKFNAMEAVDQYGDAAGVSPKVIRTDDEANARANAEQQAIQKQQQAEQLERMSGAANKLAGADMQGDNALTRLLATAKAGQTVQQ